MYSVILSENESQYSVSWNSFALCHDYHLQNPRCWRRHLSPRQLPVVSGKRIVRALDKAGFEVVGTRGSHCKLRLASPPRIEIVRFMTSGYSRLNPAGSRR